MEAKAPDKRKDPFKELNKKFDEKNSKMTCEITAEPNQTVTIDMAKGTVSVSKE
jgi:hypothetical protein